MTRDRPDMASIVRSHYDAVYRFCAYRAGNDLAPDLAQDTFLTAQRVLPKFRGESSVRTWLFGIALNECRRSARRKPFDALVFEPVDDAAHARETAWIDRAALQNALRELSEEHREVVLLHELDGLTYEEAAAVLHIPVGTVKSRLHHAFQHLRRHLRGDTE